MPGSGRFVVSAGRLHPLPSRAPSLRPSPVTRVKARAPPWLLEGLWLLRPKRHRNLSDSPKSPSWEVVSLIPALTATPFLRKWAQESRSSYTCVGQEQGPPGLAGTAGSHKESTQLSPSLARLYVPSHLYMCVPTRSWMHMSWGCMQGALGGPCPRSGKAEPVPGAAGTLGGLVGHWDRACPLRTPHRRQGGDGPGPGRGPCQSPTLTAPIQSRDYRSPPSWNAHQGGSAHSLPPGPRAAGLSPPPIPGAQAGWPTSGACREAQPPRAGSGNAGSRRAGAAFSVHPKDLCTRIASVESSHSERSASALLSSPATSSPATSPQ